MIPVRIAVQNFNSYTGAEIDFTGVRSAMVVGDTGAGKSTLFVDAFLWATTGQCRAPGIDDVIRLGADECGVDYTYLADGQMRRVVRTRSRKGRGSGTLEYYVDGQSRNGANVSETQKAILADLRVDYATMVTTSFLVQGKSGAFAEAPRRERMALVARMIGCDRFKIYAETGREMARNTKAEIAARETNAAALEGQTSDELLERLRVAWADATALHQRSADREAEIAVEMLNARNLVAMCEDGARRNAETRAALNAELGKGADLRLRRRSLDAESERLDRAMIDLRAQVDADAPDLDALRAAAELATSAATAAREAEVAARTTAANAEREADAARHAHQMAEQEALAEYRAKTADLTTRTERATAECRALADRLQQSRDARKRISQVPCGGLGDYATCPLIEVAVSSQCDEGALAEMLSAANAALSALQSERMSMPYAVQETQKTIETKSTRVAAAKTRDDATASATERQADAQRALRALSDAQSALSSAEARATAQASARATMDATSANVARVRGDLAAIDDAIAVSDRECAVLRGAIDAEVDARLAACRANVERLSTEAAQAARATATAAGAVANAARAIDDVGAMRKRLASERAEIQTRAKHLAHIEVAVAACKDAPQLLIESIVPSIEMKANELLSRVSNTSMQVQLRTQAELKSREAMAETLDVIVVDEIGERPYEMYSGGERFRIDFALRVALSWALSIRAGAPLEMLVIDEGFGTQDAAGKQAFAECLNSVNDLFEKVIVISHVPEMESAFPARFRVTKGPSGSTIAREV